MLSIGCKHSKENRAAKIVTNSAYAASALPITRKLSCPTINELIESETLKMVYKSANNQAPINLTEMFLWLSDACKRELCNTKTDLAVPRCKSAFGQKGSSYKGDKLWNDLSVEVKSSKSYEIFKKVTTMPTPNADSLFRVIVSITLNCL